VEGFQYLDASAATVIFRRIESALSESAKITCIRTILGAVKDSYDVTLQSKVLRDLAPYFPESLRASALDLALSLSDLEAKVRTLVALALCTTGRERDYILEQALDALKAFTYQDPTKAMVVLVSNLPDETWKQKVLDSIFMLEDNLLKIDILMKVASKLPERLKIQALHVAYDLACNIPERKKRENTLLKLMPQLPSVGDLMQNGLRTVVSMRHLNKHQQGLKAMVPRLSIWAKLEVESAYALWQESLRELSQYPRQVFIDDMRTLIPFTLALVNKDKDEKEKAIQGILNALREVSDWWP
jgi:hypothetical protein